MSQKSQTHFKNLAAFARVKWIRFHSPRFFYVLSGNETELYRLNSYEIQQKFGDES